MGIPDAELWALTLRQFMLRFHRHLSMQRVQERRAWATSVATARLVRGQAVNPRDLFEFLGAEPPRVQTEAEQLEQVHTLMQVFGGQLVQLDADGNPLVAEA